mmetsp:Transcript_23433/g.73840  ORF Transcript_23433/g.73840 Transcript_23433/m.73840 type:complete len:235 (-) Transcript_23433:87-791(-)
MHGDKIHASRSGDEAPGKASDGLAVDAVLWGVAGCSFSPDPPGLPGPNGCCTAASRGTAPSRPHGAQRGQSGASSSGACWCSGGAACSVSAMAAGSACSAALGSNETMATPRSTRTLPATPPAWGSRPSSSRSRPMARGMLEHATMAVQDAPTSSVHQSQPTFRSMQLRPRKSSQGAGGSSSRVSPTRPGTRAAAPPAAMRSPAAAVSPSKPRSRTTETVTGSRKCSTSTAFTA